MTCEICSSSVSDPIKELFSLSTVTSDCRPWSNGRSVTICSDCGVMKRVINKDYKQGLYEGYKSYPEPTGRTQKILEFIKDKISVPKRILDIGAGKGDGMRIMGNFYPDSLVFGYEPTINAERPNKKFDLITLFHVLEHVEDLNDMLDYIKSSLTENGHVLIQVPYTAMWPFDLVIADHVWHFTIQSLDILLGNNGFRVISLGNNIIKKEITLLANIGKNNPSKFVELESESSVNWILQYKKFLDGVSGKSIVYGTGPAASWTGNILGDKVDCYLDDDKIRCENYFNGRIVFPPKIYPKNVPIIAPFPDWQLPEIKAKNPQFKFL